MNRPAIVNNNEIAMRASDQGVDFALRRAALCDSPGVPAGANNNEEQ
jgi:hypothetical protein